MVRLKHQTSYNFGCTLCIVLVKDKTSETKGL